MLGPSDIVEHGLVVGLFERCQLLVDGELHTNVTRYVDTIQCDPYFVGAVWRGRACS